MKSNLDQLLDLHEFYEASSAQIHGPPLIDLELFLHWESTEDKKGNLQITEFLQLIP